MKCPEHPNVECRNEYYTAFCFMCCKNIQRCLETYYMRSCDLPKGHEGKHMTKDGTLWDDETYRR